MYSSLKKVPGVLAAALLLSAPLGCQQEDTLTAPPQPPGSGMYPNEPVGVHQLASQPCSTATPSGWEVIHPRLYGTTTDASSPGSPPSVCRWSYPAGFTGGSSPAHLRTTGFQATDLYIHFWMKYSDDWSGHRQSGTNKIIFLDANDHNDVYMRAQGSGPSTLRLQVVTQGTPDGGKGYHQNTGPSGADVVHRGRWQRVEARFQANGTFDVWLEGVQIMHYTGVQLFMSGDAKVWRNVDFEPTYGGGKSSSVPSTQYLYEDDLYISGR